MKTSSMRPFSSFDYNRFDDEKLMAVDEEMLDKVMDLNIEGNEDGLQMKGRNSRRPKKANHGARPCSSYMRKLKQKGWYHIVKAKD